MQASKDDTPLFNYVASIQGREFIVTICQNRMSRWEDLSGWGLPERLHNQPSDGVVIFAPASEEIFMKAAEMSQKEKAEEAGSGQCPLFPMRQCRTLLKLTGCLKSISGDR